MKDYLTDREKEKIEQFYKDETMREAVRKVLLAGIYHHGTLTAGLKAPDSNQNFLAYMASMASQTGVTNEIIGADLRAKVEGIRIVESSFKELGTYQKLVVAEKVKVNKAI